MENIKNLTLDELGAWMADHGDKPFRARQVFHWLYQKRADRFEDMSTLSKSMRSLLEAHFHPGGLEGHSVQVSADSTRKYTFRLDDGNLIETVLMPNKNHYTLCVSTQAGCAMGCAFCKTATLGLARHLTPGEIVQQVVEAWRDVEPGNFIRNIVFMGMGEPLHNYTNLVKALDILAQDHGFGFSARRMTVSTSGLVPGLLRFIREGVRASLAVSLHAVDDAVRDRLMPVNRRWNIAQLLDACRELPRDARSRITFEYLLLQGVNDSTADARKLVRLLHGLKCKVNLIPYNAVEDSPFKTPSVEAVRGFQEELLARGMVTTVRISKGQDIQAACGQLAALGRPPKAHKTGSRPPRPASAPDAPGGSSLSSVG